MPMRKFLFCTFIIVCSLHSFSQEVSLTDSEVATFKQNVKTTADKTKTIISNFIQNKHLDFLSNDIETSGNMFFKAPNLIKWEYTKPYKYSVIFKSNKLLIDDDGKKSDVNISSSKLFSRLNKLIVNSVSGNMFDDNEFDISYFKTDKNYLIKFISKDKNLSKYIQAFELHFTINDYSVEQVKMIEPSGDYTKIEFKNRKHNKVISDEVFAN